MSEAAQRQAWRTFDSADDAMTEIAFGSAHIKVARPTVPAWNALQMVLLSHDYSIRGDDTHGYFPRNIEGTTTRSLHALGIAIDVNATTNPVRKTPNRRKVWFSEKRTQADRAQDVLSNVADTDMTPEMIEDVRSVKTFEGKSVFGWGGSWTNKKDPMHFHIDVTPQDLAAGIDPSTVKGFGLDLDGDLDGRSDGFNGHFNGHLNGGTEEHFHDEDMNSDPTDETFWESDTMIHDSEVNRFRPFLDFIAHHEGTASRSNDGYDTSLGYGKFTGGEKKLTAMTLNQINALQMAMLDHPANNFNSSALGRYQIVRKTLLGLRRKFGLSGGELYSRELQDSLAVALIKGRGRDVVGLREEWASLTKVNGNTILKKYDERQSGTLEIYKPEYPESFDPGYVSWEKLLEILGGGILGNLNLNRQPSQLVLKPGDRGPAVEALQQALSARNYQVGKIDGIYGTLTTAAVAAFQVDYKVPAEVSGSVDATTWTMLGEALGRPLSQERINITADDLRRMGSQTIAQADNARLMAVLTSLLGALGIGNFAIREYGPGPAAAAPAAPNPVVSAPVDQQIAHAVSGLPLADLKTFFNINLGPKGTEALAVKIRGLESLYAQSVTVPGATNSGTLQDFNNPLVSLISAGANILLPGAGGSLAILALGIASHIFGTRIIKRRVRDQQNGSNIGALIDRK
ncbi:peptidoglycan-binding protein [Mesorhizobium sp. IMUNJ 23232]|uniref:peptidoglycan-binding protein n=1 Tax=Mesorhizobium sp. IMUNJ 23232 TaxID=3376064 RepID=UPI003795DA5E